MATNVSSSLRLAAGANEIRTLGPRGSQRLRDRPLLPFPAFLFQPETTAPPRGTSGSNLICSSRESSEPPYCDRTRYSSTSRGEIGSSEHRPEQQSGEFAPANAERQMKQFKLAGQAQRFLSAHDQFNNLFHLRRDHLTAEEHRASRNQTFQVWDEICNMG